MTTSFIIAALILAAAILILLLVKVKKLNRSLAKVEGELGRIQGFNVDTASAINAMEARLDEVHASLSGLQRSTHPLSQRLDTLEGKLREQQEQDPQVKLYQKAAAMAAQGASASDIADACDLPVAEASVLVSLHRPNPD